MTDGSAGSGSWLLAAAPLMLLLALTPFRRIKTPVAAAGVAGVAILVAHVHFGADVGLVTVAIGKGAWLGLWILYVVAPALLLYRIASVAGAERIGELLSRLSGDRLEQLLIVAWLVPSLIQGIAGFGAPIALVAPLLMALGYDRVSAVAYPLIGYCWSVTFGSMASSFYMAAVTARLDPAQTNEFALRASLTLALLAVACGLALCAIEAGWRGAVRHLPFVLATGLPMGTALVVTAIFVPSLATVAAAGAGLLAVIALRVRPARKRSPAHLDPILSSSPAEASLSVADSPGSDDPSRSAIPSQPAARAVAVLSPYITLLALAFPVFLIPSSNAWVRSNLLLAPSFPATQTDTGWWNVEQPAYTPIALLGHPGTYILTACLIGYVVYRHTGLWAESVGLGKVVLDWCRRLPGVAAPLMSLTVLASVLIDSGMTATMSRGLVGSMGVAYIAIAPLLGALGSFATGSTTSSNALLASLQAEAATLLGVSQPALLTAQTVGGNVGNSLAPMVIVVGSSSVGAHRAVADVARRVARPAGALLLLTTGAVVIGVIV